MSIYPEHMEIFVESSKTDQLRDGAWVVIARTNSKLCPVGMMEHYFILGKVTGDPSKHLFRGVCNTKTESKLRNTGGLSYTRAREVVLDMLSAIGLDKRQFGLHSLRAGGASAVCLPVFECLVAISSHSRQQLAKSGNFTSIFSLIEDSGTYTIACQCSINVCFSEYC